MEILWKRFRNFRKLFNLKKANHLTENSGNSGKKIKRVTRRAKRCLLLFSLVFILKWKSNGTRIPGTKFGILCVVVFFSCFICHWKLPEMQTRIFWWYGKHTRFKYTVNNNKDATYLFIERNIVGWPITFTEDLSLISTDHQPVKYVIINIFYTYSL